MTPTDQPLRIAFVGAGNMARAHARALGRAGSPHAIVGVTDADAAAAKEFAALHHTQRWISVDALVEGTRPDIVHVCTPAGAHFGAARQALLGAAHVYVEKPFVESIRDARTLIALAEAQRRVICAGHQLLADPAFDTLHYRATSLAPLVRVESELRFRSPTLRHDAPDHARAAQLLDVLPHPLYALVGALEFMAPGEAVEVRSCTASADTIDAVLAAGPVRGHLHVSLAARPVSSTLRIVGGNGALTADFIRGCVSGVANSGTTPIEKIVNPVIDGVTSAGASAFGIVRRIVRHGEYPGLAVMFRRFHDAIRRGSASPTPAAHLLRVTTAYEQIAANVRATLESPAPSRPAGAVDRFDRPVVVVTGASGFLGRRLVRDLAGRGFRVRGVGRSGIPADPEIHEWVRADLGRETSRDAFREACVGAYAIVHAAAGTSGGFDAHQRHSVSAARLVIEAAAAAGVKRFVHVSSLSVVAPPQSVRDIQDEDTALAADARALGPYTWGKCESERVIADAAGRLGVSLRIIRPAALIDPAAPDLPGLVGRRLFGTWHLCLGRPALPFAVCDVDDAARAIGWSVAEFDAAPHRVNLMDAEVPTRRALLAWMRRHGWRGRSIWVPVSWIAFAMWSARWALATLRGRRPERLAVWQVLRPRRFNTDVSNAVLAAARKSAGSRPQVPLVAA